MGYIKNCEDSYCRNIKEVGVGKEVGGEEESKYNIQSIFSSICTTLNLENVYKISFSCLASNSQNEFGKAKSGSISLT